MPNWVYNKLTIKVNSKEQKEKVLSLLVSKNKGKRVLDFNILLPMPEELSCESGSYGTLGLEIEQGKRTVASLIEERGFTKEQIDKILELGKLYKSNIEKYGVPTWFEWKCQHWGCKWNADTSEIILSNPESIVIYYETPWSMPEGWLEEFARVMPELYWENDAIEESLFFSGTLIHDINAEDFSWIDHEEEELDD